MTVAAWDGNTLSADRQVTIANHKGTSMTKLHRFEDGICAVAGNAAETTALLHWIRAGAKPQEYPLGDGADAHILFIKLNKQVYMYGGGPYPIHLEADHHAIGSGRDFALAAMLLGHPSREAVEVACALDTSCGNGIDEMALYDE